MCHVSRTASPLRLLHGEQCHLWQPELGVIQGAGNLFRCYYKNLKEEQRGLCTSALAVRTMKMFTKQSHVEMDVLVCVFLYEWPPPELSEYILSPPSLLPGPALRTPIPSQW